MEIKIFGPGCPKCKALHKAVTEVVSEMGLSADVKKVEKLEEIVQAGVMLTPGLMVNGKLKVFGRVPGKEDIKRYIEEEKQ